MVAEHGRDSDEVELGDGETLDERLEGIDLEDDETCSTDEMRERLGL